MESEATTALKLKICSKCKQKPASNGNPWCQPCRTEHARQTRETELIVERARWFQLGARMMRQLLARKLATRPGYQLECYSTAKWIEEHESPDMPPQD